MKQKKYTTGQICNILTLADNYAKTHSTCTKTAVGCYIIAEDDWRTVLAKGANCGEVNCKEAGCLRIEKFGDNSKEHRNVCRCTHSEIDALNKIYGRHGQKGLLKGATAFVTRYPCEECTKALIDAGIKKIVYGRAFEMDYKARKLAFDNDVVVLHIDSWNCDPTDTNN